MDVEEVDLTYDSPLTDLSASESEDDDVMDTGHQRPPRKRARRSAAKEKDKDKKRSRKVGMLSMLPEMPMDVLFEILSHLTPSDLLSLARTSKPLRALLLHSSRTALWRRSYAHVPGCPSAPKGMSEPAWANLVFGGNYCHICDARPVRVHAGLLKRICKSCLSERLITRGEAKERYSFALDFLLEAMLTTMEQHLGPHRSRLTTYWWASDVERAHLRVKSILEREFSRRFVDLEPSEAMDPAVGVSDEAQDELDQLLEDVQGRTAAHKKFAARFAKWQRSVDKARRDALRSSKKTRKEEIVKRLLDEGFDKADVHALSNHREVKSEQQLTDRVWRRVHPILVTELARIKSERLERERRQRTEERRKAINTVYDAWLVTIPAAPLIQIAPSQREIYAFPPFAEFIDTDVPSPAEFSPETFIAFKPELEDYMRACAKRRYDVILRLRKRTIFTNYLANHTTDADEASEPPPAPPGPLEISPLFNAASCAFRSGWNAELYFGQECLLRVQPRGWRGTHPSLAFDSRASGAVKLLCECLGLAEDVTPEELDAHDPGLVCLNCPIMRRRNAPEVQGRVVFSWRDYAAHAREHGTDAPAWKLLTTEEATSCGFKSFKTDEGFICSHCAYYRARLSPTTSYRYSSSKRWGSKAELVKHVDLAHNVATPVEGDDFIQLECIRHEVRERHSFLWAENLSLPAGQNQTGYVVPLDQEITGGFVMLSDSDDDVQLAAAAVAAAVAGTGAVQAAAAAVAAATTATATAGGSGVSNAEADEEEHDGADPDMSATL